PAPTAARPHVDYSLEVVAIYPGPPPLAKDPRFDGFRRNWLNIFQLSPSRRALANNAASDVCAITVYEYSAVAERTPPLAAGLTALDLIRETLDRYLGGMKGCGLVGYTPVDPTLHYDYLDSYPSLLIAASDYVHGSNDEAWLKKNYAGIKVWTAKLLAMDKDDDGLVEYPKSGNSGTWDKKFSRHAANWWDTIGFGHKDAYSNALAYHALLGMADLAKRAGQPQDARLYASRAAKLRSIYFKTFYNPATGVLAGWKSADGKLHDYYFTFVNGMAITYGLVPPNKANQIMDHLLVKMKQVGYTHFEYGLPGNLTFVPDYDYLEPRPSYGGGGSKGFQNYENGGATACFAYYTIKALYQLGRRKEADTILFPMLRGFEAGGFQGRDSHD
ncbi:MAG: MGH1-like glycoside hydrolase domain-containing protein, partial [Candidatus Dormibacteraceae bacterium]